MDGSVARRSAPRRDPAAALPDLAKGAVPASGLEKLPPALRAEVRALCLIRGRLPRPRRGRSVTAKAGKGPGP